MQSVFFERVGRVTYRILKGLLEMPWMILKTLTVAVPLFTFWISVGLIAFGDVTLSQIIDQPKTVFLLAFTMSAIVAVYTATCMAKRDVHETNCAYDIKHN